MRRGHRSTTLRTFGVEEEMLLVDRDTFRLSPAARPAITSYLADVGSLPEHQPAAFDAIQNGPELTFEVKEEMLEIVSPPVLHVDGLEDAIREGRRIAARAAATANSAIAALGASPFLKRPHVVPHERYQRMVPRFGIIMREHLTCGFHVHVAVADQEEGVAVLDRIRTWLPVVLALSTNSPFWHDQDSGFASFRYQVWGRWPTTGPTGLFGSAAAYRERVDSLMDSGLPLDKGMLYFDARFSPRIPTVEIRVADVCADPADAATIAGLVRALVETAVRDWHAGIPPNPVSAEVLRVWMYQASLVGVDENLVDVRTQQAVPASDAVAPLMDHVRDALADAGEESRVEEGVHSILARGTGADAQRAVFRRTHSLTAVVADAMRRTAADHVDEVPAEP